MKNKKKHGFSLIELEIVMVIIATLTTISMVSLQKNRARVALEGEMHKVTATIQATRNYALSGKNACVNVAGCNNIYIFKFEDLDSDFEYTDYKIQFPDGSEENYKLENDVNFAPLTTDNARTTRFSAPWSDATFPVLKRAILRKGALRAVVCVYSYGRIEEFMDTQECPT